MRKLVMLLIGIGLLAAPATTAAAPLPASKCQNITGTFIGQAVPTAAGFDIYVVELTGPLGGTPVGEKLVEVTVQKVTPGGAIHFTGIHEFQSTAFGDLVTHDRGTIAPSGRVHNTLTVVEGGSGFISVHGTVDLAAGVVDVQGRGRICTE